ncbi:MAG: FHA domain-containing protein [Planctomycetes bacterium]|nr:FHA domain-containing protein [Planctomycetota bacterium]
MALFGRKKDDDKPSVVVLSYGGREGLLPKFTFQLDPERVDIVGRDEACSIQILDPKISRRQFSIGWNDDLEGYVATDLESANGTFVNGIKIGRPTKLHEGDTIEIGNSKLTYTTKRFKDQVTAIDHFKREGERFRGTMQMDMREE